MPLLIPLALLLLVLAAGVVLAVVAMLRRPFLTPAWRPVFGWVLVLRAMLLALGVLVAAAVVAWRHPPALGALGLGLGAGGVFGLGAALGTQLRRNGAFMQARPPRPFAPVGAPARASRTLVGAFDLAAGRDATGLLPMLGGLLGGYALAHAVVLRMRLARSTRLQAPR